MWLKHSQSKAELDCVCSRMSGTLVWNSQTIKWPKELGLNSIWLGILQTISATGELDVCPSSSASQEQLFPQTVQFSHSVVSDSLWPCGLQHARPPCLSPTAGVYPNSRPLSQWCQPTISSSVVPFSSCLNPSPHQGLFQWVNSSHEVAKVLEFQL